MAHQAEAYDFSLFEEKMGSTAPILEPQIEEQPAEGNVVELPEQQPGQSPKHRRSPLRMMAAAICFAVVFATAISAVHSEVLLTELTEEINEIQTSLTEAESLEVQLNMQAAQKMTEAQVEEYAMQQLGMGKMMGSQVTYLHVATQDKGTVVQDIEGGSPIDRFLAAVRSWLAG